MKNLFLGLVCGGVMLLAGCATAPHQAAAPTIEGTWKGQEVVRGNSATSWLTISGGILEFKGAGGREMYRGNYTLNEAADPKQLTVVITESPAAQYVGKTAKAVYEVIPGSEGHDTLVITGNEPGDPQMPSGLGDRRGRQILFSRD